MNSDISVVLEGNCFVNYAKQSHLCAVPTPSLVSHQKNRTENEDTNIGIFCGDIFFEVFVIFISFSVVLQRVKLFCQ